MVKKRKQQRRTQVKTYPKSSYQRLRAEQKAAEIRAEKQLFAEREAIRLGRLEKARAERIPKAIRAETLHEEKIQKALPRKRLREFSQGIVRKKLTKTERLVENKVEGDVDKTLTRAMATSDYVTKKLSQRIGSRRETKETARAVRGIASALGVIGGKQTYKGAGRPRGTFKYGMPIQVYKAQMRQKRDLYRQYQQEQVMRLRPRGFTPQQLQQLQQQQTYEELEQPSMQQVQRRLQQEQQIQQAPQRQVPMEYQKMRVPTNTKYIEPGRNVADDELDFRKWSAEQTISPNTQRILDTVRRIQNKGKSDNIEQQRRIRERNMVMRSMNMMKAHENMIDTSMDFTGVKPEDNILFAPNVFKENAENNILRSRGANLLNTNSYGNTLNFARDDNLMRSNSNILNSGENTLKFF